MGFLYLHLSSSWRCWRCWSTGLANLTAFLVETAVHWPTPWYPKWLKLSIPFLVNPPWIPIFPIEHQHQFCYIFSNWWRFYMQQSNTWDLGSITSRNPSPSRGSKYVKNFPSLQMLRIGIPYFLTSPNHICWLYIAIWQFMTILLIPMGWEPSRNQKCLWIKFLLYITTIYYDVNWTSINHIPDIPSNITISPVLSQKMVCPQCPHSPYFSSCLMK